MKRFAIKFPDGRWSKGGSYGSSSPVPFEKAKLWKNIGHVKNHLKYFDNCNRYPPGCEIVEVVFSHEESLVMTVADALLESRLKAEQRKAEQDLRRAQRELERAQEKVAELDPVTKAKRKLAEAQEKARNLGVKV